jgi:hypothetical protein
MNDIDILGPVIIPYLIQRILEELYPDQEMTVKCGPWTTVGNTLMNRKQVTVQPLDKHFWIDLPDTTVIIGQNDYIPIVEDIEKQIRKGLE